MPGELEPLGIGFSPCISRVAAALGATLDDEALARIVAWFDLLATWNKKVDLTAAHTKEDLTDLMLADAIVIGRHEPRGNRIVDIGSGAGGPGLALHIVRPDLAVTLVEPQQKRASFLRSVMGQLGPAHEGSLRLLHSRAEDIARQFSSATPAPDPTSAFDSAVARATFSPEAWLHVAEHLVQPGGAAWVLLAREPPPVLAGWDLELDEAYRWPLTGAERRAVRYRRLAAGGSAEW